MIMPRENCPSCGSAVKGKGVLRRAADIGKENESIVTFFFCSCGNRWSASYLVAALGERARG